MMNLFLTAVPETGAGMMADGFTAMTTAIEFAVGNPIIATPIAIGLGCFGVKKAKSLVRR